ncbi:MAG: hypothetical protein AAB250_00725, partial [Bdellovibrionota bacterium]
MQSSLALIFLLLLPQTSFAVLPQNCAELEAAYLADSISQFEFACFENADCLARQALQLREAAKERDSNFDPLATDQQLETKYGPSRTKLVIGTEIFDGVSLFVDFVSTSTYYVGDTTNRAPLSESDGVVFLAGKACGAPLAP